MISIPLNMRIGLVVILFAMTAAGCAASHSGDPSEAGNLSERESGKRLYGDITTIEQAKRVGVDYQVILDGCTRQDGRSMHILFWLATYGNLDAGGSGGYSGNLGELLRYQGDGFFGHTLAKETPRVQEAVHNMLGYDYGMSEGPVKMEWLKKWYPITFGGYEGK